MDPLPVLDDDGLTTPIVGEWGEEKYQLVRCYADVFATSMKDQWECRVYVDLFAGAGRSKLTDSQRIVPASPLLALGIKNPFDRYIFCDLNSQKLNALKARVARDFPNRGVEFIQGDANERVPAIIKKIPAYSKSFRVLTFCFVDPFNIESLKFETIKKLAAGNRRIDFLILVPSGMDAQRNWKQDNSLYADFLGNRSWREEWAKQQERRRPFANFFIDEFAKSMEAIGFRWNGVASTRKITNEKNSTLYRLAFFSRASLATKFWDECKKYTSAQDAFTFMH